MIIFVRKTMAYVLIAAFLLTGCASGIGGSSPVHVGPSASSAYEKKDGQKRDKIIVQASKLDIIIPAFDANLPKDSADYKKAGVWPELRRAESVRFAYKMKLALEKTGKFGAVRVMPDVTATADLYVIGTIKKSNGEEVAINLKVYDIGGKKWFNASFDHTVKADFYNNIRNKGKDAYAPVFEKAAAKMVKKLQQKKNKELAQLQQLTNIRFGANFSEETFAQYMKKKNGKISLISYPADNDPMLQRLKGIRVRDQMFVDRMQAHYQQFNQKMDEGYKIWQKQSFEETKAAKEASKEALGKTLAGIGLIALGVFSAIAGSGSNSIGSQTASTTGAIVAGQIGIGMLGAGAKKREEAKFHRDALDELGQSVDAEIAPQVVEFEKTSKKLTGNAKEQFAQWRIFLKKIYAQEATPDVQL
ncbi:MAG: hypothetical protein Q9M22_03320 [Mariprofundaceae bacterium]|nr:hypothetical protein [Mariprofundaceae bacterium]